MSQLSIGLDIGGSKIAGALFNASGAEVAQITQATPRDYGDFLDVCCSLVRGLEEQGEKAATIGACAPYADAYVNANVPFLIGRNFQKDLQERLGRAVPIGNDANCAALAEAIEGAGRGHESVFGLIIGTGVGGGFIYRQQIVGGANGLCGEIGHLPLPYYEESDGERVACGCGQSGCIEKLISGGALARLYARKTGANVEARHIASRAEAGEAAALAVLDHYYTVVAKAMVVILHSFDPDIITVSGGISALPELYREIPRRWGRFALSKSPKTAFVQASFGVMAGLRGAALLGERAHDALIC